MTKINTLKTTSSSLSEVRAMCIWANLDGKWMRMEHFLLQKSEGLSETKTIWHPAKSKSKSTICTNLKSRLIKAISIWLKITRFQQVGSLNKISQIKTCKPSSKVQTLVTRVLQAQSLLNHRRESFKSFLHNFRFFSHNSLNLTLHH